MTELEQAIRAIRKMDDRVPDVAMILGSGLGPLADEALAPTVIPGHSIPGYPEPGVSGHQGDILIGDLSGKTVVFLRGRFHRYEGHRIETLTYPTRIAAGLGASRLIVTNAAGSLHPSMPAGSVMRITDHINGTSVNPLLSMGRQQARRGTPFYDNEWGVAVDQIALDLGIRLHHGVYIWTLGPSYETPAEIRHFRRVGADAVGMSTVPEVSVAAHLGMKVVGLSAITNLAAGLEDVELSHGGVLETGRAIQNQLRRLVVAIIDAIPERIEEASEAE